MTTDNTERYEHEILDSSGATHRFSLTVEPRGLTGTLVWPAETSKLEQIRRTSPTSISAIIVWPTLKIRCWVTGVGVNNQTELEIKFAFTPYRYQIKDGGAFVDFIAKLDLPPALAGDQDLATEQAAPPGYQAPSVGCGFEVRVEDRSNNHEYAYFFLTNDSNRTATVTLRRSWNYEGARRSDTPQHVLHPGASIEVFSFPRNQSPLCDIVHCSLA